jgi:NhaP-type Na+/H+ or K+/H+ antiporter
MADIQTLSTLAATVMLGVAGQILASATRMPAIVFLLCLGMLAGPSTAHWLLGPDALPLVNPKVFGPGGLSVISSAFVAIILFEGGLTLTPKVLREAAKSVRRLVTLGAVITLCGAAVLTHYILELSWSLSFVYASLIVITGPTVIGPILRRTRLSPRVHAVLKSESILIDPIGAIMAIAVLQYTSNTQDATVGEAFQGFLYRFGMGFLVGVVFASVTVVIARIPLFRQPGNEHLATLGALGIALGSFAASEYFAHESGVMAATTCGLFLAAVPLPFREDLEKFKDHLTTLGVSVLFILLAANVDLKLLSNIGWREGLLLLGVMFLVRPLSVFISTAFTGLNWREQAYISLLGPRGIMAAAMAAYAGNHLSLDNGQSEFARYLEALVFLTIAVTVLVEGGWATPLAHLLGVAAKRPGGALILGVNRWSLELAAALRAQGLMVSFVDSNPIKCEVARERGFPVKHIDATDPHVWEDLDLTGVGRLVAMTPNEAVNTLACDAGRRFFGEQYVLQVATKPTRQGNRSKVRTTGHWAMPSTWSFESVNSMLHDGMLLTVTERFPKGTMIGVDLMTSYGKMVPMLILSKEGKVELAVDGTYVPPGGAVIGLVESPTASESAAASSDSFLSESPY